ncbi:hypothetical protein WJX72_004492 [[Myrmecia] bisecta]|uniref:SHSP domain-containing protein n=1 Tax=[Myrmecia] bisecta TaxID=41462 RepID=A0AAW1QF33_9CHLO
MALALGGPFFGGGDFFDSLFGPVYQGRGQTDTDATRRDARGRLRLIPLDVKEYNDHFEIKADIPGVGRDHIKLLIDGDVLTLDVERPPEKEEKDVKWHRMERQVDFARRSIRLPDNADLSKIKATYVNGVLTVEIPKIDQKGRQRQINVE